VGGGTRFHRGARDNGGEKVAMTQSKWRARANSVIARVARDNPGATDGEMKDLLFAAYPFGHRGHHPYKIWREAVNDYMQLRRAMNPAKQAALDLPISDLPLFSTE